MKWVFNSGLILNNEILFYGFVISIILMIAVTWILVSKELKKENADK